MAKGFIDQPQDGECVQRAENLVPVRQSTQITQTGQGGSSCQTSSTPDEEQTENGTISSASSQENLPPMSASCQASPQQSPASSAQSPSAVSQPTPTQPPAVSHFPLPDHASVSAAPSPRLPSPVGASLPSLPVPAHPPHQSSQSHESSPPQSFPTRLPTLPPSSPSYLPNQPSISVEELQELAIQDSANNNVDENSNDQQYDRYANYHQEYSHMQFPPEQSVRPRVRRVERGGRGDGDEPDRAPPTWNEEVRQAGIPEGAAGYRYHRRNLSEGPPLSPSGYRMDTSHRYPPLPNLNTAAGFELPQYQHRGREQQTRWEERTRGPRSWLPLSLRGDGHGPPQPPEDTTRGAQELLVNFTTEVLHSHHLNVPQDVRAQSGFSNPAWMTAGRELRMLADNFAKTEERRRVRCMAETVNMQSMNMENFFQLCAELFSDGITRERIVALFTFVGDVAVYQVRHRGEQFLKILLNWSLKYLVDHVCRWVQDAGGWAVVLSQGASILYQTAVFAFCVLGTIAAGMFIYKTYKDW